MLRLLTYNLESLGERPGSPPLDARIAVLRPRLTGLAADILCLQEIDGRHPAKGRPREPSALQRVIAGTIYEGFHVAVTPGPDGAGVADRHNLMILSRLPIVSTRAVRHELVAPPALRTGPFGEIAAPFDRPLLYACATLADGQKLHLINLHLRAPLPVPIPGTHPDPGSQSGTARWAAGYQLAAMKRSAQALEARLLVDRLLDEDAGALIAVCGDLNAGPTEVPVRLLTADRSDSVEAPSAERALVPLADAVPAERRFTVRRHGQQALVDHVLASQPLAAHCRAVEIHNQGLADERDAEKMGANFTDSTHAPMVAVFDLA
ncbi:endonuclease/exonuclease/phosphatase family protein [Desertibaculum subflavum]|uniref:endonuclease/exonuclease/phosphatase family protein n=1 Tax=Desertibaculum subflavum TaxID=2268458 RepID=UPI000E6750CB